VGRARWPCGVTLRPISLQRTCITYMGHEPKLWGKTKTVPQGAHPLYRLSTASKRKIYQSEKRKVIGQTTQLDNHIGAIRFFHIPSDLVVDSGQHMLRAAQPLISRGYTTRGRKTSHKIKPTISRGCDFTTQSGGVWEIQTAFSRRPAGPAAPWALACHPVCCPSPPVRPAARRRAGLRHCRWCWTGAAAWGRVGPQGCPGATAAERATGKAGGRVGRFQSIM
jgi:hypothetical protein